MFFPTGWPEAEKYLDADDAVEYAHITGNRIPRLENELIEEIVPGRVYEYWLDSFNNTRWPALEQLLQAEAPRTLRRYINRLLGKGVDVSDLMPQEEQPQLQPMQVPDENK
jgi:hypothetical protein